MDNDPVKKCDLYKDKGCVHVDGLLCDFPDCAMNEYYLKEKNHMKASELMLGNIIERFLITGDCYDEDNVSEGRWYQTKVDINILGKLSLKPDSGLFRPVILTPEWIEELSKGLVLIKKKKNRIIIDRFELIWTDTYKFWTVNEIRNNKSAYITKIEFVHEWQNLFRVLNNEELKTE